MFLCSYKTTTSTYYCVVSTPQERNAWINSIKVALEFSFGNPKIFPYKPSKSIYSSPEASPGKTCNKLIFIYLFIYLFITLFIFSFID